ISILNGAAEDVSHIVNEGSITAGGSGWTYIGDDGNDTLINRGTMTGAAQFGAGDDVLHNFGTLTSGLYMQDDDDVVVNRGTLDWVDLGAGNDLYDGRGGTLTGAQVYGGAGDDIFILDRADVYVFENVGEGTDTIRSTVTQSLSASHLQNEEIENLRLIGNAAINGMGNGLANVITGNGAANVLSGLDGNDTIRGGGGNDKLFGGDGSDLLRGGAGNDTLAGGAGGDTMAGGAGNDVYILGPSGNAAEPVDTITELAGQGIDLVKSAIDHKLAANVENLTLTGTLGVNGTGNGLANVIIGNGGNNQLQGGAGNDVLRGAAGMDLLFGGKGNDMLTGGGGADRFVFNTGDGHDTITDFQNGIDRIDLRGWSAVTGINDLRNTT
ncbi:MAG TPA: calcium-binding protein, partial [Paracoccaceae bacterium]